MSSKEHVSHRAVIPCELKDIVRLISHLHFNNKVILEIQSELGQYV